MAIKIVFEYKILRCHKILTGITLANVIELVQKVPDISELILYF